MVHDAIVGNKQAAADRYGISWRAVNNMCVRVATEALGRVDLLDGLVAVAIDEVKYKKGQRYLTVVAGGRGGHRAEPLGQDSFGWSWPTWMRPASVGGGAVGRGTRARWACLVTRYRRAASASRVGRTASLRLGRRLVEASPVVGLVGVRHEVLRVRLSLVVMLSGCRVCAWAKWARVRSLNPSCRQRCCASSKWAAASDTSTRLRMGAGDDLGRREHELAVGTLLHPVAQHVGVAVSVEADNGRPCPTAARLPSSSGRITGGGTARSRAVGR